MRSEKVGSGCLRLSSTPPPLTSRLACTLAVATAALLTAGVVQAQAPISLPDNPLHGRLLFESRHCNRCHGLAGVEEGPGPSLGRGGFGGSLLDLGAAMWNHVPGMSVRFEDRDLAWPHLDEVEIVELLAFVYAIEYLGRPGDASAGRHLFTSRGCSGCHSLAGKGGHTAPDLARSKSFASPLLVAQAIWNHGPTMLGRMQASRVSPPVFSEGDLADLSAFLRQSAEAGGQERVLLSPGNPNRGREVFTAKGCVTCHAVLGHGGGAGPDLGLADLHRSADGIAGEMWNHALAMQESMREKGIAWPQLTPGEFADLVAYLYFLPFAEIGGESSRGAEVFTRRLCADCHVAGAARIHPGPDLARSQAARSAPALVAAMWNHAPVMKEAIVGGGLPWPELTGRELRDLLAYLRSLSGG